MIVLTPRWLISPGGSAEHRKPVVGRSPVLARIGPDIPVSLGAVTPARQTLDEPWVLVGGMAEDLVKDHPQSLGVSRLEQVVEVVLGAVVGLNTFEVCNVVAPVAIGGRVDWRKPDPIDAEALDVVKLGLDAGQVALSIPVAVEEAADIYVVEDRPPPPRPDHRSQTSEVELTMRETRPYSIASSALIQKFRWVSLTMRSTD